MLQCNSLQRRIASSLGTSCSSDSSRNPPKALPTPTFRLTQADILRGHGACGCPGQSMAHHQRPLKPLQAVPGASDPDPRPVRRLIMMRHAHSEEPAAARDHERQITPGGREAAQQVAAKLVDRQWVPDLILCSNSTRTQQTLEAMRGAVAALGRGAVRFLGSFYTIAALDGQTQRHLQEIIAEEASSDCSCVMCLGHNKGWEEAACAFSGENVRLETSFAALLEGRGHSWEEVLSEDSRWRLVEVLMPDTLEPTHQ